MMRYMTWQWMIFYFCAADRGHVVSMNCTAEFSLPQRVGFSLQSHRAEGTLLVHLSRQLVALVSRVLDCLETSSYSRSDFPDHSLQRALVGATVILKAWGTWYVNRQ